MVSNHIRSCFVKKLCTLKDFIILWGVPVVTQPEKSTLDDSALWQHSKGVFDLFRDVHFQAQYLLDKFDG
uniref:Uncharacterized protein n=1 Tax=Candidatus Kentrum sp. TC TaxID=2126339 RepID=A0A450YX93_9GAMM|nr:MAG: hypothetical protein BECKTC1821E_GA0114239_106012 [Candidatus Kentron sp. TC]